MSISLYDAGHFRCSKLAPAIMLSIAMTVFGCPLHEARNDTSSTQTGDLKLSNPGRAIAFSGNKML